ncbi:ATP-dependent helicase [Macrococcus equi]|uniref:ATP-dependent helicase n=1 Tax=Macrococcus equi TaxID=3395462 RepID=UPI0039BEA3B0
MKTNNIEAEEIKKAIKQLEQEEIKHYTFKDDIPYLKLLNDSQKIAATRMEGNYLVLAGPGAGKTHTLIYRVIHMVNQGVSAQEICIVTFTRKAANQLKNRIKKINPEIELGFIGTIHALAYTLVRRGLNTKYRLIDSQDDLMVLKLSMEESNVNLPSKTGIKTIHKIFDYKKLKMISIDQALIELNKEELRGTNIEKIFEIYEKYKKENGYINYSDVILLATGADRGKLNYLMVDEFQDTDPLQLTMFKALKFPNVMGIGDDFQSIYSFRGADNKIILKFGDYFKEAKLIKLNINYRSNKDIVNLENFITQTSDYGYKKKLIPFDKIESNKVEYFEYNKSSHPFIFEKIKDFDKQENDKKLAIIYRFNNNKHLIEPFLIQEKIDYVVYGGIRLLDRKHIKDVFALLLANKDKNDFIPYMRSLMLLDGIGEVSAKKLIKNNMKSTKKNVNDLRELLFKEYREIDLFLQDAKEYYLTLESVLLKANYTKEEIIDDFELLTELAKNYNDISNFISDIILEGSTDKWSNKEKNARIVLTTIHSSKGLEFDEVHFLYDAQLEYDLEKKEENRRLFYTAISRAANKLYIYDSWGRTSIDSIIQDFLTERPTITYNEVVKNINKIDTMEEKNIPYKDSINTKSKDEKTKNISNVANNKNNGLIKKIFSFIKKQ